MGLSRISLLLSTLFCLNISNVILQSTPRGRHQQSGTPAADITDLSAANYLQKFGYIDFQFDPGTSTHADLASAELFTNAIKNFQNFAKLPITGELDAVTKHTMKLPRCGLKDDPPDPDLNFGLVSNEIPGSQVPGRNSAVGPRPPHGRNNHRTKRYVQQGSKWPMRDGQPVTYTVKDYTQHMSESDVDAALAKALGIWESNAGITFKHVRSGSADIVMRFAKRSHGDNDPFDGPGGVLAHAYYPVYGGATHFDDDETWGTTQEANNRGAKSLVQVAVHELGHALGLGHSDNQAAIMAPFYRSFQEHPVLDADDIQGIQYLYGPPSSRRKPQEETNVPVRPSPSGGGLDICREKLGGRHKIDAITKVKDGSTYAFSGQWYWKLGDAGIESGYPRPISQDWSGLPDNLDSAVTWREEGRTYFFNGDLYWRFTNQRAEAGYPRRMSVGFPGIPTPISAAFIWSGNGKLYFVKGREYWQFITDGPENADPIPPNYPRQLSTWLGVQQPLDAAFEWRNGMTYFFSGGEYSGFDDREFKVDESKYPRDTLKYWFGCQSQNLIYSDYAASVDTGLSKPAKLVMPAQSPSSSGKKLSYVPVIGPVKDFEKTPAVKKQPHATMRFISRRSQVLKQQNDASQSATEDPRRHKEAAVPIDRQPRLGTTVVRARQF